MSLAQMELRELVEDLLEISNCIEKAMETQSVHAPPEVRARGKAQRPIFLKCESLLSEELHRRLGGRGELAEVAIDAMEEYIVDQQKHKVLAATFGPLESREDVEEREAEERDVLGCTIRDIEAAEAFAVLHPEALCDTAMLHDVAHHIDHAIAENERRRRAVNRLERTQVGNRTVCTGYEHGEADCKDMEALAEHIHIPATGTFAIPEEMTVAPVSEPSDTILNAMKQAAWDGLQRLGTDVLVEYLKLWIIKHHDYGTENHAVWGCQGAIIRATDKLMRLKGSYFDSRPMKIVENDWLDLIGYGLIGLVIERGQWPVTTLEAVIEDMKAKMEEQATIHCPVVGGVRT